MDRIRKTVKETDEINWLFQDVSEVIKKLKLVQQQHHDAVRLYINDAWTGYEDVSYELVIVRYETPEEEAARLEDERIEAERLKKNAQLQKAAKAKEVLKEIAELNTKLRKLQKSL